MYYCFLQHHSCHYSWGFQYLLADPSEMLPSHLKDSSPLMILSPIIPQPLTHMIYSRSYRFQYLQFFCNLNIKHLYLYYHLIPFNTPNSTILWSHQDLIHQFHHCFILWCPLLSLPSLNSSQSLKSMICIYLQLSYLSLTFFYTALKIQLTLLHACIFREAGGKYKHTDQSYFKFIISYVYIILHIVLGVL